MNCIKKIEIEYFCFKLILNFAILQNLLFWVNINSVTYFVILVIAIILCFVNLKKWLSINSRNIFYLKILVLTTILWSIQVLFIDGIGSMIFTLVSLLIGMILFLLTNRKKADLLKFTTDIFCCLILVSIIAYLLFLFIDYPPYEVINDIPGYDSHLNYIFFILPDKYLIPRFSGPFVEPGHLSILCCFLLYANRFKFSKNRIMYALLFAILLSLSLAGYILLFVSYLIYILYNNIKIKYIVLTVLIISCGVGITYKLFPSENPLKELIFARLAFDETKGIAGNNRTHGDIDRYISQMINNREIYFGIGAHKYDSLVQNNILSGAGYKIYLIQYGYVGMILFIVYYGCIAYVFKYNKYSLGFFFIILICFIQRAYPTWIAWLLPYICAFSIPRESGAYINNEILNKH